MLMIYGLHVPLTTQTEYIECKVGFPVCLDTKCSRTMLKGSLRVLRSDKQMSWDLPGAGTVVEPFGKPLQAKCVHLYVSQLFAFILFIMARVWLHNKT